MKCSESKFDITMKNIFLKKTTKKNEQIAVTKEPPQGWCRNALQKKYIF